MSFPGAFNLGIFFLIFTYDGKLSIITGIFFYITYDVKIKYNYRNFFEMTKLPFFIDTVAAIPWA